jgi:hypothetical protein
MFLRNAGITLSPRGVTTQKTNIDIFTAVRTSDLSRFHYHAFFPRCARNERIQSWSHLPVRVFQLENRKTDSVEIWYERYAIGSNPNLGHRKECILKIVNSEYTLHERAQSFTKRLRKIQFKLANNTYFDTSDQHCHWKVKCFSTFWTSVRSV